MTSKHDHNCFLFTAKIHTLTAAETKSDRRNAYFQHNTLLPQNIYSMPVSTRHQTESLTSGMSSFLRHEVSGTV